MKSWQLLEKALMQPFYRFEFIVPSEVVDGNRHVNNVAYLQWMQDAAIAHSDATGSTALTQAVGGSWVVRIHRIEYFSPAFAGEGIVVLTWVADFRKVRSLRRYRFIRVSDRKLLAEGETDWVFVDAQTGKPRAIPQALQDAFGCSQETPEL